MGAINGFNPIYIYSGWGGGGGGTVAPYRVLPGCTKTACSRMMKLSDF